MLMDKTYHLQKAQFQAIIQNLRKDRKDHKDLIGHKIER